MDNARVARLEATKPAAHALLEDIASIRKLLSDNQTPNADVRALSVTLRRILVNSELKYIAAPRIGKFYIEAPDLRKFYRLANDKWIEYFVASGGRLYGCNTGPIVAWREGGVLTPIQVRRREDLLKELSLAVEKKKLTFDQFLHQKVAYINGYWITRSKIILHAAVFWSGAHTKTPKTEEEISLSIFRNSVYYKKSGNNSYALDIDDLWSFSDPAEKAKFRPGKVGLNGLFVEVVAAATYLVESPDVLSLEETLLAEFS